MQVGFNPQTISFGNSSEKSGPTSAQGAPNPAPNAPNDGFVNSADSAPKKEPNIFKRFFSIFKRNKDKSGEKKPNIFKRLFARFKRNKDENSITNKFKEICSGIRKSFRKHFIAVNDSSSILQKFSKQYQKYTNKKEKYDAKQQAKDATKRSKKAYEETFWGKRVYNKMQKMADRIPNAQEALENVAKDASKIAADFKATVIKIAEDANIDQIIKAFAKKVA